MGRSADSRDVANYSALAAYYDELLQDEESLSYWLDYIETEPFDSVLELASGSGVMAKILSAKGHAVTASDLSLEMMSASRKNYDGEYLILNMTDYHLGKQYDLVLCICDSINYLETDELDSFFACAAEHLHSGGRLLFDMHHQERLKEFAEEYVEEDYVCGVPYQWTILSDPEESTLNEHFTFYTAQGMVQEHHTQNVFPSDVIEEKMKKYFEVQIVEDFIENEKILVIGRKL